MGIEAAQVCYRYNNNARNKGPYLYSALLWAAPLQGAQVRQF